MSRFCFSKIGRERFSRAARLLAGIDKTEARTNQQVELGRFCCATLLRRPLLWLTKPREPGSRDGDTICDLPSRLKVGDEPRASRSTPAAPFPSRVSLSSLLLRVLLLSRSPMDRRR